MQALPKIKKSQKISAATGFSLNLFAVFFIVVYCATSPQEGIASNFFGVLLVLTFAYNLFYAAFSKRKEGLLILIATTVLLALVFVFGFFSNNVGNFTSLNFAGIIALILIAGFFCFLCAADMIKPVLPQNPHKILRIFMLFFAPVFIIALSLVAHEAVFNVGFSHFEGLNSNIGLGFLYLAMGFALILISAAKGKKQLPVVFAGVIAGIYSFVAFLFYPVSAPKLNIANVTAEETYENMRQTPFSVPDLLFGIKTNGYNYDASIEYADNLYYDVFYPSGEDTLTHTEKLDGKYPVIVRFHGRNRDKSNGNMPGASKYFAMRGYVVFDVQYGDWNERGPAGEKLQRELWLKNEEYLANIHAFFEKVLGEGTYPADFSRTVLYGNSFGGQFAQITGLTIEKDAQFAGKLDIDGIIAFYPAYMHEVGFAELHDELYDYTRLVGADSPPLLMLLGTHDGYINKNVVGYMKEAYAEAGNLNFGDMEFPYAGHGFDAGLSSVGGQYAAYYTERFLIKNIN